MITVFLIVLLAQGMTTDMTVDGMAIHIKTDGIEAPKLNASYTMYRGRIYPVLDIILAECPSNVEVYRGGRNITDLAKSSLMVAIDGCNVRVDGYRLRSLGYLDGGMTINITGDSWSIEITVEKSMQSTSTSNSTGQITGTGFTPPAMPYTIVDKRGGEDLQYMEVVAGLTLAILFIASVVYEIGIGGGDRRS